MNRKKLEYLKACERGTREAGVRLLRGHVVRTESGRFVSKLTIGHHPTEEDAEAFLETVRIMLNSQKGRTTDYFQWGFRFVGDDICGNCYFKVVPLDYYERHGSFDGNPFPYFQLPTSLGFSHESESTFRYGGDETEGRGILIRMGLKELDCG
jgi:hypothetical protein